MSDDNIQVAVRVRPILKRELKNKQTSQWTVNGNEVCLKEDTYCRDETFTFDYIHDINSTNLDVFKIVQPLVFSTLTGFNATIFAYGQTSSGKTHSILGNDADPGIIPRSAKSIFTEISRQCKVNKYVVKLSYIEIYNEKIIDLLDLKNVDLKFSVAEDRKSSVLVGMHEEIIHNEDELMEFIGKGNKNRQIGETKMNERSSRSHVICDIFIECAALDECANGEIDADTPVKAGHLYIVDLAGSERISQTGATGARLNEGVHINKSLSALISVITALSTGQSYVSYRNSKLTMYLNTALCGNSRTLMLATITPASVEDSLSTLRFARSAKTIKTKPKLNELVSQQSLIKRQEEEVKKMRDRIQTLEEQIRKSSSIYVPFREIKPKRNRRRHTMAASTDFNLEPITEINGQEDEDPINREPEQTPKENYSEIVQRLSQPLPPEFNTIIEAVSETIHTCECKDEKYEELVTQFNHLDESHATLKEFIQTEYDVRLQDATEELKKERDALLLEREAHQKEIRQLKETYDNLNISHFELNEFTKIETDIATEERNKMQTLQLEYDSLKQRLDVMEGEREFLENAHIKLKNRCSELRARIDELETKPSTDFIKLEPNIEVKTEMSQTLDKQVSFEEHNVNHELEIRCKKLEDDIKLIEMHSKILQHENNVLKARRKELTRSYSDTNLSALTESGVVDETTKEDFQGIYKSMRLLTSAIVSGMDANDMILGSTPLKVLTPLRRWCRTDDNRQSFADRITSGIRDEDNELRQENVLLKEHTNELLVKLKTLNDKLNERDVPTNDVAALEEKIAKLKLRNDELERNLSEDNVDSKFKTETYCRQLEDKVKVLEIEMQKCEKAQDQFAFTNITISELRQQLSAKEEAFASLQRDLEQTKHEHGMDKESLNYYSTELDEAMAKIQALQSTNKSLHKEVQLFNEENRKNQAKAIESDLIQEELAKLKEELLEKQTELRESNSQVSTTTNDLQVYRSKLEVSNNEVLQLRDVLRTLQEKVDGFESTKEQNKIKLCKLQKILDEKEQSMTALQRKHDEAVHEWEKVHQTMQDTENELLTNKQELAEHMALRNDIKDMKTKLVSSTEELAEMQAQLNKKDLQISELQKTLSEETVNKEILSEQRKIAVGLQRELGTAKQEYNEDKLATEVLVQSLRDEISTLQAAKEDLHQKIVDMKDEMQEFQSQQLGNIAKIADFENTEAKNHELVTTLQSKLATTIHTLEKARGDADEASKQQQHEIAAKSSLLEEFKLQISELNQENVSITARESENKEKLATFQNMIAEKDVLLERLQNEYDKLRTDQTIEADSVIQKCKEENKKLLEEITTLASSNLEMKSKNLNNTEKVIALQTSLAEKEQLMKDYKALLESTQEEFKSKINELEEELTNSNTLQINTQKQLEADLKKSNDTIEHYEAQLIQSCTIRETDRQAYRKIDNELKNAVRSMEEEVKKRENLQIEIAALREQLSKNKSLHSNTEAQLSENLKNTNDKYIEALEKIKQFEAELIELRKHTINLSIPPEVKQLDEQYQYAVAQISTLEKELEVTRKSHQRMQQIDVTHKSVIARAATLPTEDRIKFLSDELHKNRIENSLNRDNLAELKRSNQQLVKEKENWEDKPKKAKSSQQKTDTTETIPAFILKKRDNLKMKVLEDKLIESDQKYKLAVEEITDLKGKHKAAELLILELTNNLNTTRMIGASKKTAELPRCDCAMFRQKCQDLRQEHEQFIANKQKATEQIIQGLKNELTALRAEANKQTELIVTSQSKQVADELIIQNLKKELNDLRDKSKKQTEFIDNNQANLKVDTREIIDLENKLLATQKLYEAQIAMKTEEFERKFQAGSDNYMMLKKSTEESLRSKDSIIKDLQNRVEQACKENAESSPVISGKLLSDANHQYTTSSLKLKIHDLQKQVQAARSVSTSKAQQYEHQITLLRQDYETKLAAMQKKLDSKKTVPPLSAVDLNAKRIKEQFSRRIDAELLSIPAKMLVLDRITSTDTQADTCVQCVRRFHCLSRLRNNCMSHSLWPQLGPDSRNSCSIMVKTERFDELTKVRDVFQQLLEHPITNEARNLVTLQLNQTNLDLKQYEKGLKEKEGFLKFLHNELSTACQKLLADERKDTNVKDVCEKCAMSTLCGNIVRCLTEGIQCSMVILEQLGNNLVPVQFVLDDGNAWQSKLDALMANFEEQTNARQEFAKLQLFQEKYKRAKRLAELRYHDVKLLEAALLKEGYMVDFKSEPIRVFKKETDLSDEDNPRPSIGKSRDMGRKSLGATPKHFSQFFFTPDEHKVDKNAARRNK